MTIQLSNCCKAKIDLNKTKERPECYTCSKCGRIIGSPLPPKTNEDWRNKYPLNTFKGETRAELERLIEEAVAEVVEKWRKSIDEEGYSCAVKIEEAVAETRREMQNRLIGWSVAISTGEEDIDALTLCEELQKSLTPPTN